MEMDWIGLKWNELDWMKGWKRGKCCVCVCEIMRHNDTYAICATAASQEYVCGHPDSFLPWTLWILPFHCYHLPIVSFWGFATCWQSGVFPYCTGRPFGWQRDPEVLTPLDHIWNLLERNCCCCLTWYCCWKFMSTSDDWSDVCCW
jgi:hypothetical protein